MVAFRFRTGADELSLVELPWHLPLEEWPVDRSVVLPAGVHRHVVRFMDIGGNTVALKELPDRLAEREYTMLEGLREQKLPGVTLVGIATERVAPDGEPLEGVLVTRHLRYSLPYRMLFSDQQFEALQDRVVDALAVLLVRLHLDGFFWGDCSLNNALFRRDAGALRAYVVDTETAEWHDELTDGQRSYDLQIAVENVLGGLFDLQASDLLNPDVEPETIALRLEERYRSLWSELNDVEEIPTTELGRIHARLARLNELGFDTEEYELRSTDGIARFRPTIVEEGHHVRTLERLTGIVAHENQARVLLSALRGFGAWLSQTEGEVLPEAVVAYRWLTERYRPTIELVPETMRDRLEEAEIYHEVLAHNWAMNDSAGADVPIELAALDYVDTVLAGHADERTILPTDT
ncbi:MAG: DUF4032 domain-containing protein [Actinomycetota bacterium]